MRFYGVRYPKRGKKQRLPAPMNDPRLGVSAEIPTAAPEPTDMRSDRTYPDKPKQANSGKLFQRTSSRYGVDGPENHGASNGVGRKR